MDIFPDNVSQVVGPQHGGHFMVIPLISQCNNVWYGRMCTARIFHN